LKHDRSKLVRLSIAAGAAALFVPPSAAAKPTTSEEHGAVWLDDSYGKRALGWVKTQTDATYRTLSADPRFATLKSEAEGVLTDPTSLPDPVMMAGAVYDYHQSREAPLGIWRRASTESFLAGKPQWETLIDLDALSAAEKRKWIFAGSQCRGRRCLVRLSENGKDATDIREFDLDSKQFVRDGFAVPLSKTRLWWYDDDTLLAAPALDRASLNNSLLPKTLRVWRRGTQLARTKPIFEIGDDDAMLSVQFIRAGGTDAFVVARHRDFEARDYRLMKLDGSSVPLPLPQLANIMGVFDGRLLLRPNVAWTPPGSSVALPAGVLAGIALDPLLKEARIADPQLLYVPAGDDALTGVTTGEGRLFVSLLHDYRSRIVEVTSRNGVWASRMLPFEGGRFLQPIDFSAGKMLMRVEAPLVPEKLVLADPLTGVMTSIFERSAAFDASNLMEEVAYTASSDGTPIAYTLVRPRNLKFDGTAPTLVYGYGGYDVAITPRYEPIFGKLWMEKGGVYVHAYLRGGGEHGPGWHRGAMRKTRQQPYDDMQAILRDLQRRGITSPAQTGIMGRSNGGLMVAAVLEQTPELVNAVVVGGPLIDMLNFHELPPGGTWTAEYGDPRDPDMRAFLQTYSPMQHVAGPDVRYPTPLIITATDDDRVLPGHARRFSERLTAKGHPNLYWEDKQGGHYWELAGGPAPGDWRLRSVARSVEFTYLWRQLGGK
jgi:prolyl oligopeptidase